MMTIQTLYGILSCAYIFFAIATATTPRFWVVRRNYFLASVILSILILATGYVLGSVNMIILGVVTFATKAVAIPLIMKAFLRGEVTPKIPSRLKPTLTRFTALFIVVLGSVGAVYLPNGHFVGTTLPLTIAAFSSIGIAMLTLGVTTGTYGQLFGVLMLENAFSLLILALGLEFQIFIELGLLTTAIVAWLLMNVLSGRISHLFGVESVEQLNELSE